MLILLSLLACGDKDCGKGEGCDTAPSDAWFPAAEDSAQDTGGGPGSDGTAAGGTGGDSQSDTADDAGEGEGEGEGGDTGGEGGEEEVGPTFSVVWGPHSVELVVSGGAGGYRFGMAEVPTEWDCGEECWTGEDCVYGYEDASWCHPASQTGVELLYGATPDDVEEGEDTVFYDPRFAGQVAYYIQSSDTDECWIGGADTSWFTGLGCTEVELLEL